MLLGLAHDLLGRERILLSRVHLDSAALVSDANCSATVIDAILSSTSAAQERQTSRTVFAVHGHGSKTGSESGELLRNARSHACNEIRRLKLAEVSLLSFDTVRDQRLFEDTPWDPEYSPCSK